MSAVFNISVVGVVKSTLENRTVLNSTFFPYISKILFTGTFLKIPLSFNIPFSCPHRTFSPLPAKFSQLWPMTLAFLRIPLFSFLSFLLLTFLIFPFSSTYYHIESPCGPSLIIVSYHESPRWKNWYGNSRPFLRVCRTEKLWEGKSKHLIFLTHTQKFSPAQMSLEKAEHRVPK